MNKKEQERLQRYLRATAPATPESEEVQQLRRSRSNLRARIDELRTRWQIPGGGHDRSTDEDMANHLETVTLLEVEAKLRDQGASI